MALTITKTENVFGQEVTIPNAYHRIERINGNKDLIEIELLSYDESQSHMIESNFYKFKPSVQDDALNFIKQGYNYLKTLPEFMDAVDS